MLKVSFKLFLFAISAVFLLAVSGYQSRVDSRRGVETAKAGTIQMGRRLPPAHSEKLTPSMFDWVRYAMEGGHVGEPLTPRGIQFKSATRQ